MHERADPEEARNGALPRGMTWRQVFDVNKASEDHKIYVASLANVVAEESEAELYKPDVQQRLARIEIEDPVSYKSGVLKLAERCLAGRWRDWAGEIDLLSQALHELDLVPLSSVQTEAIDWLWQPYIAYKKLTLLEGEPSAGKTFVMLAIAAALTRGYTLPDQQGKVSTPDQGKAGTVIYLTAEDGLGDTLRPRAEKVGADLERFYVPSTPQTFSLDAPEVLSNAMARHRPRLLILDPLQAFLGPEMD